MKKLNLGELFTEFHSGESITADRICNSGRYPVFGGNGLRGYTSDYNHDGDYIIIGRQGAKCGNVRYYSGKSFLTEHAIIGRPKDEYHYVAVSYLLSMYNLGRFQGQSAQPGLSVGTLSKIPIAIDDNINLSKVGDLLLALDTKISLNRKINAELEKMAKELYDYWFVQLDFPDKNGNPYKSSGGKMVYNPQLKREIPEGWGDTTLNRYIGRITNGLNPRKNFVLGKGNNYYVTIRSLLDSEIDWDNCDRCDNVALNKINSRSQLQIGDVIFSAIGTIGRTYRIFEKPQNWNISETSFTLRPADDVPQDFFYSLIRSDEVQLNADKNALGSTLRCLVMDSLCGIPYVDIPVDSMVAFSELTKSIYFSIYNNNKEKYELKKLRNQLLPLLINGQILINK